MKKRNVPERDNKYYTRDELLGMGFEHLLKQEDEKIAAKEAGLDLRPVTTSEIQGHLDGFGLPQEFGTYGKIKGLSGGQKVKLVLAAAFWQNPHLIVMVSLWKIDSLSPHLSIYGKLYFLQLICPLFSRTNLPTSWTAKPSAPCLPP